MNRSRRIWGWLVFTLGLLWLVGGLFGLIEGRPGAWLFALCGLVLARMGYNLRA